MFANQFRIIPRGAIGSAPETKKLDSREVGGSNPPGGDFFGNFFSNFLNNFLLLAVISKICFLKKNHKGHSTLGKK